MASDRTPPHIENVPGLVWKPLKSGWRARWQARTDLVRRGYRPRTVPLWEGDEQAVLFLQDRCRELQSEMLVWGRGGIPQMLPYDGTLAGLIACYQTDPDSRFRTVRFGSRLNYESLCKRLVTDHGTRRVEDVRTRDVLAWHRTWSAEGHIAMAHSLIGMLRSLLSFGSAIIEDRECRRLKEDVHELRFTSPKPRNESLTAEQAVLIRQAANAAGRHAIALGQALAFELMLRQRDVIGEWVPVDEPGTSEVLAYGCKWLRGLRWSEIDEDMIVHHVTSKRGKELVAPLTSAPMVLEELSLTYPGLQRHFMPASGPVIVHEGTGVPFQSHQWRREWRALARSCGIPDTVWNMDSRSGGITEALRAGARLDAVRKAATHSNVSMTQRYSRADAADVSRSWNCARPTGTLVERNERRTSCEHHD